MYLLLISLLWSVPFAMQAAPPEAPPTGQAPVIAVAEATAVDEAPLYMMRAEENLRFGSGVDTGREYYDVVITSRPSEGVLIKLPYTQKGGKFTFDLHHRVGLDDDFGLPAEIMTVVEILTGGTNRLGTFTILDVVDQDAKFDEEIDRISDAEIDRYVTPLSRKTITIDTQPGPQSVSIVGRELTIARGALSTRIDVPGTRIAMVSNFKFEEVREVNPLKRGGPGPPP